MSNASIKKSLANKKWYHQRFDGAPFFIYAVAEAETMVDKRRPRGSEAKVRVCFFDHGKADWYLDMADVRRGANTMVKLARKNKNISTRLLKQWCDDEMRYEKYFWHEFLPLNLKKLSHTELLSVWQKAYKLYLARFTSSAVIDHFALGTDELVGQMLRQELKFQIKGSGFKESDFTNTFAIATAPVRQSFINLAEIELLKIVTGKSKETLNSYQKRYFWINNNYTYAKILSLKHFKQEVRVWRQSGKDLRVELKKLQNTPLLNRRRKQVLFKQYKFSPLLKTLLKISEDFTWWQDERKKSTYLNTHLGTEILKEVARRTGYTLDELQYLVTPELGSVLAKTGPRRHDLQARRASSVFVVWRGEHTVITGQEVKRIHAAILGKQKHDTINDIRGLSASLGRAIGKVRIVKSSTEMDKVLPGDILVAVMTRPDYVPAMKKAAAIVTNEGGITCHAAIVSRELGIPCIIGTKIATEVFKDGDVVEVNANHGWVRRI